jgi:hypothetical protein
MINTDMRTLTYIALAGVDDYGQEVIGEEEGTIKMSINHISTSIQDSISYSGSTYFGLTKANVNDTYIINYENLKLKVLYVIPKGRYKQVFMREV